MIIVMTNRKLENPPTTSVESTAVTDMGVVLGEREGNQDIVYSGLLSDDDATIEFYPRGGEGPLFSQISNDDRRKPWVVFVHGFHQDPDENIGKARQLHDNHEVNVITFAWPSKPLDLSYDMNDAVAGAIKGALTGVSLPAMLLKMFGGYVTQTVKDTWHNYEPARQNADNSTVDLRVALDTVSRHLSPARPPVLLVHSMGNYLLQKTVENGGLLPGIYSNIVMHQADVNSKEHDWVEDLNDSLVDNEVAKLYVTINAPDSVLGASSVRRFVLNDRPAERLGQTRHRYVVGKVNYLDFTDAPGVETEHEFFRFSRTKTNPFVFDCLGHVFRAENDGLPQSQREIGSGFARMPTQISLWNLALIVDPTEDDEGDEWDSNLVDSLDWFEDPLAEPVLEEEDD